MIVVGGGNLGTALATNNIFSRQGFVVTGIFDVNPNLKGKHVKDAEIMMMSELEDFVRNNPVDIAVLTVPKDVVQDIVDRLQNLGVKAFWNFAHLDLEVADDVVVQNVHLSDSLMRLSLNMIQKQERYQDDE